MKHGLNVNVRVVLSLKHNILYGRCI